MICEDGEWRILEESLSKDYSKKISSRYVSIGCMDFWGTKGTKNYNAAIENYNKALQYDNTKYIAYRYLGSIYLARENYDNALACFENYTQNVSSNTEKADGYALVAVSYVGKENYVEARNQLEHSLKHDKNNQMAIETLNRMNQYSDITQVPLKLHVPIIRKGFEVQGNMKNSNIYISGYVNEVKLIDGNWLALISVEKTNYVGRSAGFVPGKSYWIDANSDWTSIMGFVSNDSIAQ